MMQDNNHRGTKFAGIGMVVLACSVGQVLGAIESRDQLKTYFETGDIPTEEQFVDLIDSVVDLEFTFGSFNDGHSVTAPNGGISVGNNGWAIGHLQDAVIGPGLTYESTGGLGTGSVWPGFAGFLGFRFEIQEPGLAPTLHYGFLEMSVDGPATATPHAIRITGVAYETTPNAPITTFSIPEPTSATLAGLVMVCCWCARRRRR